MKDLGIVSIGVGVVGLIMTGILESTNTENVGDPHHNKLLKISAGLITVGVVLYTINKFKNK